MNLAYFNKGDQPLVNGSGVLAVIVMKGADASAIDLSSLMLIGPDYSLLTVDTDGSGPVVNITEYDQDDVTITMTNEFLPTDDGTDSAVQVIELTELTDYAPFAFSWPSWS